MSDVMKCLKINDERAFPTHVLVIICADGWEVLIPTSVIGFHYLYERYFFFDFYDDFEVRIEFRDANFL